MTMTTTSTDIRKNGIPEVEPDPKPQDVVRLSVNLAVDVAGVLKSLAHKKNLSLTETVRRAIAVLNFVEAETGKGNKIAVVETVGGKDRVREVVLL